MSVRYALKTMQNICTLSTSHYIPKHNFLVKACLKIVLNRKEVKVYPYIS